MRATVLISLSSQLELATYPVIFTKPTDALASPMDDIHIHPEVQSQLDYEGEMTVIIERDAKNVSEEDALDYVLGYTVGNDLSARDYQVPAKTCGGQFSYAKSFDQFAPIGPCILSAALVPDPQQLQLVTKVNGEVRQKTSTDDMIWSTRQIISHLTRGTTLKKGTIIMTGTPAGVGLWSKPSRFLSDGDMVEIYIDGIGAIRNKIVFD